MLPSCQIHHSVKVWWKILCTNIRSICRCIMFKRKYVLGSFVCVFYSAMLLPFTIVCLCNIDNSSMRLHTSEMEMFKCLHRQLYSRRLFNSPLQTDCSFVSVTHKHTVYLQRNQQRTAGRQQLCVRKQE